MRRLPIITFQVIVYNVYPVPGASIWKGNGVLLIAHVTYMSHPHLDAAPTAKDKASKKQYWRTAHTGLAPCIHYRNEITGIRDSKEKSARGSGFKISKTGAT